MKKSLLLSFVVLTALGSIGFSLCASAGDLPDKKMTPGAINESVTQENIHETICVKGYTKTIRPPSYFTNKLKKYQIGEYGYADTNPRDYEEDHLIALSIGGNPTDVHNLWPQPRNSQFGAEEKDGLELKFMNMVCRGQITLAKAQHDMATDWIAAYKQYGGEKYHGGNSD